ncbi:MAG TPA: hypothetical protein PKD37_03215 [Oligoflexia bacterium]|nr:hypothetical protein [Oligoflexia bacterium]HMP26978.1 hypothetical protein [Oligoflexia bacterium]
MTLSKTVENFSVSRRPPFLKKEFSYSANFKTGEAQTELKKLLAALCSKISENLIRKPNNLILSNIKGMNQPVVTTNENFQTLSSLKNELLFISGKLLVENKQPSSNHPSPKQEDQNSEQADLSFQISIKTEFSSISAGGILNYQTRLLSEGVINQLSEIFENDSAIIEKFKLFAEFYKPRRFFAGIIAAPLLETTIKTEFLSEQKALTCNIITTNQDTLTNLKDLLNQIAR